MGGGEAIGREDGAVHANESLRKNRGEMRTESREKNYG
jgi:hypothetical protein